MEKTFIEDDLAWGHRGKEVHGEIAYDSPHEVFPTVGNTVKLLFQWKTFQQKFKKPLYTVGGERKEEGRWGECTLIVCVSESGQDLQHLKLTVLRSPNNDSLRDTFTAHKPDSPLVFEGPPKQTTKTKNAKNVEGGERKEERGGGECILIVCVSENGQDLQHLKLTVLRSPNNDSLKDTFTAHKPDSSRSHRFRAHSFSRVRQNKRQSRRMPKGWKKNRRGDCILIACVSENGQDLQHLKLTVLRSPNNDSLKDTFTAHKPDSSKSPSFCGSRIRGNEI
ncbi:hypothetical protein CEXT_749881 [Caerostris extrusa]|uniref:Uncharacterized protein n=1 Tax=Caerostris extrusa TaxID=172846 RepID=A0AAV4NXE4_CAEEX|nr:hypothetical protein CEXT_749881 [Caerostris extrusa]